jgi:TP901 family phage tail tape measure protein
MGKTISDEKIRLSIVIDGNSAQKELFDLEKSTRKLTEENKGLLLQKRLLEKQNKQETEEYKLLTRTIKENNLEITQNKAKMAQLQKEIGITGLTMGQLSKKAFELKMLLRNLVPGTADYQKYAAELKQVSSRMAELSGKAEQSKLSMSSIASGFSKYQGLALSFMASLTGVAFSIQKIIDINGKLSDAQADVMKTTGMNKKEVDELTKSFGALETRTSRIDLLKIAEQGGRIGIMKDDIGAFVDVMNKASVSLGDSFTGGAEEVANKLGKIKFLFAETKDLGVDKAYNAIGSAINDLGANGVASEANIAEFTTRIGSLTDVLKPTIQETLALGTAFEESGIEAEVSARAYNIFMKQASTESAKFAKVMGISQKSVENMINTNPLDFMMKFAEGMRGMNATDTAKTLDYLGVNADGANKVIGAMGNNLSRFRELIDLSNNSFASGTSLINEYNIKNETLGATLEKIGKKITEAFSSEGFINWLATAAIWFSKLIGATEDADGSVQVFKNTLAFAAKVIAVVTASLITNSGWQKVVALTTKGTTEATWLYNVAAKARAFADGVAMVASQAYAAVTMLMTGNIRGAIQAFRVMTATMMTTPWGFILSAIAAVGVAYMVFRDSAVKAATAQETFAKQQKDLADSVSKSTADTKANLASLISLVKDEGVSMSTRKKAYEDLIKISPIFNGYLKDEKFNIEGLLIAYNDYLMALDKVTYARQFNKLNESNIKKQIDAEQALFNAEKKMQAERSKFEKLQKAASNVNYVNTGSFREELDKAEAAVAAAKANLENTKSIVTATNDFRTNEIKKLETDITLRQLQIKKLEDKYGADVAQKTSKFRQLSLQLESDRKALEAIIGKQQMAPGPSNFTAVNPEDEKGKGKKDPNSTAEEIAKLKYDNEAKYGEMSLKLQRQLEDERYAAKLDSYQKEMELENERYVRQMQDLEKQKVHSDEIVKMDAEISKAKSDGDITKYNALLQIKEGWQEKNKALDAQINQLEISEVALHNLKVSVIEEKWANESLKKKDEQFRREKTIRETNFNEQLTQITSVEQAKLLLKDSLSKRDLNRIKTLDDAKKALQDQFNKEEQKREVEYLTGLLQKLDTIIKSKTFEGIDLDLLTPEQKDRFQKQIEEAKKLKAALDAALAGNPDNGTDADYNKKNEEDKVRFKGLLGNTDILGFSPEQWQEAFDHLDTFWGKMSAGMMVIDSLRNVWGMYDQMRTQQENNQLKKYEKGMNAKKAQLKNSLDHGLISQKQYDKAIEIYDKELDRKKAAVEHKQAKRKRTMALADVAISTAKGVMSVMSTGGGAEYADFGVSAAILSALVIATGVAQAAMIMNEPLPSAQGYEDGLYPDYVKRQQDGKVFKSTGTSKMQSGLYSKPRILVGEGPGDMPEMVIDKQAYASLSPETKSALLRELRGIKGFEGGMYNDKLQRYEVPPGSAASTSTTQSDGDMWKMAVQVMSETNELLRDLRDNPIQALVSSKDWKSVSELMKSMETIKKIKDKSKK